EVLSAYGIKAYIYPELRPTPCLSFALRELGCIAGINVTASHNPTEYNGYKVYWEDGAQIGPEQADVICDSIASIDIFEGVPAPCDANEALIETIGKNIDERYVEEVLCQRVNPEAIPAVADSFSIVYTPLHGAGITMVPDVLRKAGVKHLSIVEKQAEPDGDFPTLRFPNPEFPEAFALGREIADEVGSELIVATDPDADRVGVMAKDKSGEFKCITGNQMGALLLDYIITAYRNTNTMPDEPYAVKSIVSTALAEKICDEKGVKMYDVLTGFKFIGEVIKNHLAEGHGTFLLGFEESYGYLKGTYARDKDAVVAALLICEMAAYYKARGMTLCDARDELFEKYGYYIERTTNFSFDTPDGAERMAAVPAGLRANIPTEIAGKKVLSYRDYKSGKIIDTQTGEESETGLPASDILYYTCEGCISVVRPSGTEPKLKIYFMANGKSVEEATNNIDEALASMKEKTGI
ncbi:MAG: phospho-sugar mutase, partial [Clostridia bacterium]|nr:phospho-sugar mutase [Clostridia bacterium]